MAMADWLNTRIQKVTAREPNQALFIIRGTAIKVLLLIPCLVVSMAAGVGAQRNEAIDDDRIARLGELEHSEYVRLRQDAIEIGPGVVESLARRLANGDDLGRQRAAAMLNDLGPEARGAFPGLLEAMGDPQPVVRREAAAAIGKIGPEARSAALTLSRLSSDPSPDVRASAVLSLGHIGAESDLAKAVLLDALDDDGRVTMGIHSMTQVREQAALALAKLREDQENIAARIVRSMSEEQPMCCRAAGNALAALGRRAIPRILQGIDSNEPAARAAATWAITVTCSNEAISALTQALDDDYAEIRCYAAVALGRLGPQAAPAVPALLQHLDDEGPYGQRTFHCIQSDALSVSSNVVVTLGQIGTSAKSAIPELEMMAEGGDFDAARALYLIDPSNEVAFHTLHKLVDSDDEFVGGDAAWTLGEIGRNASGAVPALTAQLSSPHAANRAAAAFAVSRLSEDRGKAIEVLRRDIEEELVPWAACEACRRMGPTAEPVLPALLQLLRNGERCAQDALAGIGQTAVPPLVAELNNRHVFVRVSAAECLGQIRAEARNATQPLVECLEDDRVAVRIAAARALGRINASHQTVVPALAEMLEDDEYALGRIAGAEALAEIGSGAHAALPILRRVASQDKYKSVRSAALRAIEATNQDSGR